MQTVRIVDTTPYRAVSTDCDGCGHIYTLRTTDADGILIGDECPKCEYYTTRYQRGMEVV